MAVWEVVLLFLVALVGLLFAGGAIANARRRARDEARLHRQLAAANAQLAAARAEDRGWDPELLEAAARRALEARGGGAVRELHLVQVVDRPGTEDDQARFRAVGEDGRRHDIVLGRHGGEWGAA